MPSRVHWSDLRIGVISAVVIVALVMSILLFARVGALHGDTQTLYVTTDEATGVLKGTEVWLAGQQVGLVKAIRFRPVTTDTTERLAIETDILADRMPFIRKNSDAHIRPGGNLIGSPVVYISPGTAEARAVRNGDTIGSRTSGRMAKVGAQVDTVFELIGALAESTGKVLDLMSNPSTSVGALRSRGVAQIISARAVGTAIGDKATRGSGTLGLANRTQVGERIGRVLAQRDSITLLVSSGRGNVGRFRRDSTLFRQVASVRAGLDSIRALFSTKDGGVARLRSDATLKGNVARARAQLDSLMKDIKKRPMRYIAF